VRGSQYGGRQLRGLSGRTHRWSRLGVHTVVNDDGDDSHDYSDDHSDNYRNVMEVIVIVMMMMMMM